MLNRRGLTLLLAFASASVLALGACRQEGKSGADSAESHAPGTTLAKTAAPCAAYAPGTPGVMGSVCNGPAVVKVHVKSGDYVLKGGTCSSGAAGFKLTLGVEAGPELGGPAPDHVSFHTPVASGAFSGARISLSAGGKPYVLHGASGQITGTAGSFDGSTTHGTHVTGSFNC
jgi:hypothetical protein